MWKILVAFIIFAVISLFVLFKSDGNISMQGEAAGHDMTEAHETTQPATDSPAADKSTTPAAPATPADTEKK